MQKGPSEQVPCRSIRLNSVESEKVCGRDSRLSSPHQPYRHPPQPAKSQIATLSYRGGFLPAAPLELPRLQKWKRELLVELKHCGLSADRWCNAGRLANLLGGVAVRVRLRFFRLFSSTATALRRRRNFRLLLILCRFRVRPRGW